MSSKQECSMFVFWVTLIVSAFLILSIMQSGCNTLHGIGQDLIDTTQNYVK